MAGWLRAVLVGLTIGLLPVIVVLVAKSGIASPTDGLAADIDAEYIDEQLALYAATSRAQPLTPAAWKSELPPMARPTATPSTPGAARADLPRPSSVLAAARPLIVPPPSLQSAAALVPRQSAGLGVAVPLAVRRWEELIVAAAARSGLDPNLVAALMMTESGGDPNAISPAGAVGLMQIMGGPRDPAVNVDQGATILAGHVARFGRHDLALAAYSAGAGAVERYGGIPPYRETRDHVFRVLVRHELYSR